ncbi:TIM-barrel domain-containing protein [Pedobacter psychrodurus]|uniref:TIM-barrel domain-containing protein n=1 Tax=Pedobacter psychrodurus TaxID=2530456 RepID=UPI00292D6311|nr:TIM-barrel domain-containing protein [Pedobacter psychrodurus]
MMRYSFAKALCFFMLFGAKCVVASAPQPNITTVGPGVKIISTGQPDKFTPYSFCNEKPRAAAMGELTNGKLPFELSEIEISVNARGTVVKIPLSDDEQLYGFGLQIGSFNQRGLRKKPIVNDNPLNDLGYTHAPSTFYVSTKGYGILINTSRYTTFYCGTTNELKDDSNQPAKSFGAANSVEDLYQNRKQAAGKVVADIPGAKGIEIFIFEGPDLLTALKRYNLFSGGGALPPMWALGVKYRVKADFNQSQVGVVADYFRKNHIPCDVIGLEPKWQTTAYSCSYVWNEKFFPSPNKFTDTMYRKGFKLNLWEHAFVNSASPLYNQLKGRAGNYLVWNGLVPDFADPLARNLFADYHKKTFVEKGIYGFKMDECDNSNLSYGSATWSFPEHSEFPSGIDGEQMHQVFGLLYQKSIYGIFKDLNKRTLLDVRSSNAFASSYPAAIYTDIYGHKDYIEMIGNSGFSGLIWSPEVRESNSISDLMRRSQTAVLSAQTLYNSWYLQNPPWLQIDKEKNNRGELMNNAKEVENDVRKLLNFRMSLIPYLYNAFSEYYLQGTPPFRALVVDYPDDKAVYNIADEYMIGQDLLAAPLTEKAEERSIYLPKGNWYNFNSNKKYEGGKSYIIKVGYTELPLFVKEGAILPLAKPLEYITPQSQFEITCNLYGTQLRKTTLFEDDGTTFNYQDGNYGILSLEYVKGKGIVKRTDQKRKSLYNIKNWNQIQ